MSKKVSLKTATINLVNLLNGEKLNESDFKGRLSEKYPALSKLKSFDYYSVFHANEIGYEFLESENEMPKNPSLKEAAEFQIYELGDTIISEDEFKAKLAISYPKLAKLKSFDYYSIFHAKKAGYNFKFNNNTINTHMLNKNTEFTLTNIHINDITDEDIKTYKTGTYFDNIASDFGGIMGGTQYEVSAPAGTGKTTLLTQIGQYLKDNNPGFTTLFISGEMTRTDWKVEVYKNPSLSGIDTLFLMDYSSDEDDLLTILIKALNSAKYIILDSASSVSGYLINELGMKPKQVEKWIRNEIRKASEKNNSIIMSIKHVNKDGITAGGTTDMHMYTGRLVLDMESANQRFAYFEKNRRGGDSQFKRLYFKKDKVTGQLIFDSNKYDNDREVEVILNSQSDNTEKFDNDFKDIFEKRARILSAENEDINN